MRKREKLFGLKDNYRRVPDYEERSALRVRKDKTPMKRCLINKKMNSQWKTFVRKVRKSEIRLK